MSTSSPSPAAALKEELAQQRREVRLAAVLTGLTLVGLVLGMVAAPAGVEAVRPWAYLVAYLAGGVPAALTALGALRRGQLDIDLLMVLAALAAAAVGEVRDGAVLLFLFSLADTLEDYAMGNTKRAVAALMKLRPDTAHRRTPDGELETVPVEALERGEIVVVRPGERVPMDGEITAGRSALDQSPITGESLPIDKEPGDAVFAGTVNGHGALQIRVTKRAAESTLARMVELVTEAQAERAPSQRFSDWFGQRYTVLVLAGSLVGLLAFGVWGPSWSDAAYKAATLLVVASPCAIVISVPAAVLSALAAAARGGVLFKGGAALEAFGSADAIAFDKTGTLTEGRMRLQAVRAFDGDEEELLRVAAALEAHSEHPLARAVVEASDRRNVAPVEAADVNALPGMGVAGRVGERSYWVGNRRLAKARGAREGGRAGDALETLERDGMSAVLVGEGSRLLGALGIADEIRTSAREALEQLRSEGLGTMAMLTGDHSTVARAVAQRLGLDEAHVHAELMPADKVRVVRAMGERHQVAFVGDGVNDAAALAASRVGIAMGVAGSDVALETADIALLSDDLRKLPTSYRLARRANRIIRQNLIFALGVMVVMVAWTIFGHLPLPLGVLGHEGGTILVVGNGLRLLLPEQRRRGGPPPRTEPVPAT